MEEDIQAGSAIEQKIVVIVLDFFVIAELFLAMYVASFDPENLTSVFCKTFFSMLLPTLGLAFIASRRVKAYVERQKCEE